MKTALLLLLVLATEYQIDLKHELPFPKGASYVVLQAWDGPYGHKGKSNYAYDFQMPIGSVVTCTRSGRIVKLVEEFEDGNRIPGQENFVIIDHGDGIYSRFYHLTKNGVLVDLNQEVHPGDTIALSGDTGASAGPHLHFDVTQGCYEWRCQTIPFDFKNTDQNPLAAGNRCVAR